MHPAPLTTEAGRRYPSPGSLGCCSSASGHHHHHHHHHQQPRLPWGAAVKGCPAPAAPPPPPPAAAAAAAGVSVSASGRCKGSRRRRRSGSPELLRCKRRLAFPGLAGQGGGGGGGGSAAVARRNERERNRVKLVNLGFQTLRQHVPNGAAAKKMSKVETLRSAVEYIRALQQLLDEHDALSASAFLPAASAGSIPDASASSSASTAAAAALGSYPYSSASPPFDGHGRGGGGGGSSSVPGSPHSAYSSDESGYEGALSPEEQELLDFTSWFGSY
ncbi:hypothetical protein JD844_021905 [Phrynosoma platyrhinos]|uniref:BHLH domain-containing protein n=1 Tax=Phrynosoma platyrhinos TaxID=52577 RepID=A0ABQ7SU62_PHRPL|nr:hypothetical protein JD844_021905 [Phrynosoma platyrhinos]